jgi:hypothetical protein
VHGVEAEKRVWITLGGTPIKVEPVDIFEESVEIE